MWQRQELSYCSNLHPGESLNAVLENIRRYFVPVRKARNLQTMSSGLWLSAAAAEDLNSQAAKQEFQQALQNAGMRLTSLNGFPFGNFHSDIVKQSVYQPNWSQPERLSYSQQLAEILAFCLPDDELYGSISTLPIGYARAFDEALVQQAITKMLHMEHFLAQLHHQSGKKILLCLEMEPDCVLEQTSELLGFFAQLEKQLGRKPEYLGSCFDICHQGVMFEDIRLSLTSILEAGIQIGKIQVSNAIEVNLAARPSAVELRQVLMPFAQDRFLHQVKAPASKDSSTTNPSSVTSYSSAKDKADTLVSSPDLHLALEDLDNSKSLLNGSDAARIHFHIPLHTGQFISSLITSLHGELEATLQFLADFKQQLKPHLEVETYTWQVLPKEMQPDNDEQLITGIKNELSWLESALYEKNLMAGERV